MLTHHLVWSPKGNDLDVAVLVGDGVAVPHPVEVMHQPATYQANIRVSVSQDNTHLRVPR